MDGGPTGKYCPIEPKTRGVNCSDFVAQELSYGAIMNHINFKMEYN